VSLFPVGDTKSQAGAAGAGVSESIHDSRALPGDLASRLDALLQSFRENESSSRASRAAATAGGSSSGFPRLHHDDDEFLPAVRCVHQSSSAATASVSFSNTLPPLQQDFKLDYSDAGVFQWLRDGSLPTTAAQVTGGAAEGEEEVPGSPASSYDERALGLTRVAGEEPAAVASTSGAAQGSGGSCQGEAQCESGAEMVGEAQAGSKGQGQRSAVHDEEDDDPYGMFSISRHSQPSARLGAANQTVLTRAPAQQQQQQRAPSLMQAVEGDPYDMFGFSRRQRSLQPSGKAPRHPGM
jgi:hypothetical protein